MRSASLLVLVLVSLSSAADAPLPAKLELPKTKIGSSYILSDDGRWLAAGEPSMVTVWKLGHSRPTASFVWETDPQKGYLLPLAFSPDGRKLLLARSIWGKENELALGEIESEKLSVRFPKRPNRCGESMKGGIGMCEAPFGASFSPDGKTIAVRTRFFKDYKAHFEDLVFSAAGKLLRKSEIVAAHDEVYIWADSKGGMQGACSFAPDGALLAGRGDAASCSVVDCKTGKRVSFLESCAAERGDSLALAVVDGRLYARKSRRAWDALTGELVAAHQPPATAPAPYSPAGSILSDGGRYLARLDEDVRQAKVVAVRVSVVDADGKEVGSLESAVDDSHSLSRVSADGRSVLTYGGGYAHLWRFGEPSAPQPAARAEAVVDVDSPLPAAKTDPDAYAVVIGVEKYRQAGIPAVDYAARDAQAMHRYLTGPMGFDAANVVLLTNEQATKTDLEKHLGSWLKNRAGPKSRVFVYYAGHGSPDPGTGQGFLMPYESDPAYLGDTAYPLTRLYAAVGSLPTKDVTVVLDACFSGQGGRSLLAKGTRPLVNVKQEKAESNTVVLAASASNQVSASLPAARHGLLTYYLLAGLRGAADAGEDGEVTTEELFAYVRPAVERAARLQNVEQTPTLLSPAGAPRRPWLSR